MSFDLNFGEYNPGNIDNTSSNDLELENDAFNNPAGNTSFNYVEPTSYSSDPGLIDKLAGYAKNLYQDKNGNIDFAKVATLLGGTVAAFNANKGNQGGSGAGYQGGIPTLYAGRNMITAPPTMVNGKLRRAGSGGINYGGDVTYFNTKAEVDAIKAEAAAREAALAAQNTGTTGSNTAVTTNTGNTGNTGVTTTVGDTALKTGFPGSTTSVNKFGLTPQIANFLMYKSHTGGANTADMNKYGGIDEVQKVAAANGHTPTPEWIANYEKAAGLSASDYTKVNTAGSPENLAAIAEMNAGNKSNTANTNTAKTSNAGIAGLDFGKSVSAVLAEQKAAAAAKTASQLAELKAGADAANLATSSNANAGLNTLAANNAATNNVATNNTVNNTAAANTSNSYFDAGAGMELLYPNSNALQNLGLNTSEIETESYTPTRKASMDNYFQDYYAKGGEIAMAKGRYLQGETDGMADELPARIGSDQPAALSHGEFVVPADVVSHLGNGNSDAGAKKLYQMMDKIRMARTGNKKQGKKINPDKFMPGGLAAAYAAGGKVKRFNTGGTTSSLVNAGITGTESNLSNWAGPYVTNMLGQGQALAQMPYQAYTGNLTAGENPLLTGAFNTATNLTTPTSIGTAATTAGGIATKAQDLAYKPTTTSFDSTQAASYMNPYLEASLKPQLEEARRQSQITQQQNASQMTKAGAYGGGRQAILDAETQRALGTNLANITGTGYNTAFDKAMAQFNADQARKAQEAQFGATYGLQGLQTGLQGAQTQGSLGVQENQAGLANLAKQIEAGTAQRGIESEGIAADKAQFEEARANPYKMLQFQQSLLQGLPLESQAFNTGSESALVAAARGAKTVNELLANLGIKVAS